MSNIGANSQVLYSDLQATLNNGSEIDSGWLDMESWDKVQFSGYASASGMTMTIESKSTEAGATQLSTPVTYNEGIFYLFNVICRQRYMRFYWTNNTGSAVTNASMEIKATKGSSDKLSVFPVSVTPSIFSQAALVQSILRGFDQNGQYQNVSVNTAGALLTSDFGTEVARGAYRDTGWDVATKFGRNPQIDIGTAPEDMWNGGSEYTGFNATANENIEVFSADANDEGTLVSSGTATGGTDFTIVDSGATFITDGVAVGDCLINDTQSSHGIITSVDSETQVTVYRMTNGEITQVGNMSGDSYRIATTASTGAAVIRIESILDENFDEQPSVYAILNGTTGVTVTTNAMRCSRAKIITAGTSGNNEGVITIRQATTTANVFAQVPTTGQTTIMATTVPNGKIMIIKRVRAAITRANGSPGSATMLLNRREPGGAWQAVRVFELQTGATTEFTSEGGIVLLECTDVKYTIADVSDNATVAEGAIEYYIIDEQI